MLTWAGPLAELLDEPELEELELEEPEGVPVLMAGVPVLEYTLPEAGVVVPAGIWVLIEELELLLDELEDGLVGHNALPVTGTAGVVVPMFELTGVVVPLLDGVPAEVLGIEVPVLDEPGVEVPELEAEEGEAAWVKTEVETLVPEPATCVPCPVTGTAEVPVADPF